MDRLPVDSFSHDENGLSEELLDETCAQQVESDELFWFDAHFGENEPSERMFNSLQLDGSSAAYDCFAPPQHHSLDDMSGHCRQNDVKDIITANQKSDVKEDDDDDDDDIDMETMKNKFLSAWTNAKNGQ